MHAPVTHARVMEPHPLGSQQGRPAPTPARTLASPSSSGSGPRSSRHESASDQRAQVTARWTRRVLPSAARMDSSTRVLAYVISGGGSRREAHQELGMSIVRLVSFFVLALGLLAARPAAAQEDRCYQVSSSLTQWSRTQ